MIDDPHDDCSHWAGGALTMYCGQPAFSEDDPFDEVGHWIKGGQRSVGAHGWSMFYDLREFPARCTLAAP